MALAGATKKETGKGSVVPPAREDVLIYFIQGGKTAAQAKQFYDHFSKRGWLNRFGRQISNWKVNAWQWIWYRRF